MGFAWDPDRRLRNLRLHGIDLEDAARIFERPVLERPGELRQDVAVPVVAFGEADGVVIAVVYVDRPGGRWLISARKARTNEEAAYWAALRD